MCFGNFVLHSIPYDLDLISEALLNCDNYVTASVQGIDGGIGPKSSWNSYSISDNFHGDTC